MQTHTFETHDESQMIDIGRAIASLLPASGVIELHGDLGAGKTTLVRAIVSALGADPDDVSSPTFSIVNEYPLQDGRMVVHLDCYRLSDSPMEWEQVGIRDILRRNGLTFVEWPKDEFARYEAPAGRVEIEEGDEERRKITLVLNAKR